MAASTRSALSPNAPFHIRALKDFDGKKENPDEFNFKLKACLSLMCVSLKSAMGHVEENLEVEVPHADLVEMASQLQ